MSLPEISAADLQAPGPWLAALSEVELRRWLRLVLRHRDPLPLRLPPGSAFSVALARALQAGPPALRDGLKEALPQLVLEWGQDDGAEVLDDLLVLCALVRCPGAMDPIRRLLADQRLPPDPDPALRLRALQVLAGFGLNERLVPIFETALSGPRSAALAWRALCSFDLGAGIRGLPRLMATLEERGQGDLLVDLLRAQLFDELDARRRLRLLDLAAWELDEGALCDFLLACAEAGLGLRRTHGSGDGADDFEVCERPPDGRDVERTLGRLRTWIASHDGGRRSRQRLSETRWIQLDHAANRWSSGPDLMLLLDHALGA